jgi:hypothetical protein
MKNCVSAVDDVKCLGQVVAFCCISELKLDLSLPMFNFNAFYAALRKWHQLSRQNEIQSERKAIPVRTTEFLSDGSDISISGHLMVNGPEIVAAPHPGNWSPSHGNSC